MYVTAALQVLLGQALAAPNTVASVKQVFLCSYKTMEAGDGLLRMVHYFVCTAPRRLETRTSPRTQPALSSLSIIIRRLNPRVVL